MIELVLGRHYRIFGQNTVFLACNGPEKLPILKDLNKSHNKEIQGYQLNSGKLVPILYELDTGKTLDRAKDCRPDVGLDQVRPCEVEIITIDMREWGTAR